MNFNDFREQTFQTALKKGCAAAELFSVEREQFNVHILEQELDSYSVSNTVGIGLRVQHRGKNGYAYTEVTDAPEELVRHAMENAASVEDSDDSPMQTKQEYQTVTAPENPANQMSESDKIETAKALERTVKAASSEVRRVAYDVMATVKTRIRISNTLGLDAERNSSNAYLYVVPVIERNGEMRDGVAFRANDEITDIANTAKEAVENATGKFGASPCAPGKYRIIIKNEAMSDLLDAFSPMFSADEAHKGLSLMNGKEGEKVAADCVTIVDDPFFAKNPRAFDDEGTPSMTKNVIENGVLMTLLHNLKTAQKAGVASTSNAGRASAASPVGIAPSNFYLKSGEKSFDELVAEMENGIIITSLEGLHAGLSAVSGDFSLLAQGKLVENGTVVRPLAQITVAGNFITMMKSVIGIANDLKFGLPGGTMVGSPSVEISELMISGK